MRLLQVGEKLAIIRLDVKPSEVDFCVQTYVANPNDVPYRACVLFQFQQKGYVQPANLKAIQDSIAEVFSLDADSSAQGQTNPQPVAMPLEQVAGLYVMTQATDNQMRLNADGTFSLIQSGKNYAGTFTIEGNKMLGRIGNQPVQVAILQGDTILDPQGSKWVKQGGAVAPLRLPSTYVSAQTPADQLQLNADNSFSLQEGGQTYRGTFAANGNTLELSISETNTKNTVTIQGSNLTDSSGQTWVLREQPAQTGSVAGVLQNQDIIKMVKASFDDAIIIAKIGSSKCQFDTSTDALIQLKESGVSAAVLQAVVGAGK
jgi:hypothetical protein